MKNHKQDLVLEDNNAWRGIMVLDHNTDSTRRTVLQSGDYLTIWIKDGHAAFFRRGAHLCMYDGDSKIFIDSVSNDIRRIIEAARLIAQTVHLCVQRVQSHLDDRVMFKFCTPGKTSPH